MVETAAASKLAKDTAVSVGMCFPAAAARCIDLVSLAVASLSSLPPSPNVSVISGDN